MKVGRKRQRDPLICDALLRAAELLEHTQLVKGEYAMLEWEAEMEGDHYHGLEMCSVKDERACGYCAHGAIMAVAPDLKTQYGALRYICQTFQDRGYGPYYAVGWGWKVVHTWSDEPNRTVGEVVELLRAAASLERGEGMVRTDG